MKVIAALSVVMVLLASAAAAEDDYYSKENIVKFADYCFKHGEYERAIGEYLRAAAADEEGGIDDSLFFRIAVAYVRLSRPERARDYGRRMVSESDDSSAVIRAKYLIAFSYYLERRYDSAAVLSGSAASACESGKLRNRAVDLRIASLLKSYRWHAAVAESERVLKAAPPAADDTLTRYLHGIGCQGSALREKKPYLASVLSALVPGSGKVYAHRAGDGFFSLLVIGTMAWQAYEGYAKGGLSSGRCITFGLLGLSFYAGNVYGSFNAAVLYNRSRREALANRINLQFDW
jgi:tetratricopeptide (TPR) repeat protein